MINLQTEKNKAPTRVLSDIAAENDMKFVLVGAVDENITEAEFKKVVWLPIEQTVVRGDEKSLPFPVTWKQFKKRLESYLKQLDYTYNRKTEYPSIQDQLDKIFHDGLDAWKAEIQAIKDKYPEPE